jgi:hypothetical protein
MAMLNARKSLRARAGTTGSVASNNGNGRRTMAISVTLSRLTRIDTPPTRHTTGTSPVEEELVGRETVSKRGDEVDATLERQVNVGPVSAFFWGSTLVLIQRLAQTFSEMGKEDSYA